MTEGTEENHKNSEDSLAAEICIRYFPNAQRERYTHSHALGLAALVPRCHVDLLSKSS
jgi:hypothetical protein